MPISRLKRRASRSLGAALAALGALALMLTGCVGATEATPTPTSTQVAPTESAPIFASDEEALAAAVGAYQSYLDVAQMIGEDGGRDPERILDVASASYSEPAIAEYEALNERGYRITGRGDISATSLIERSAPHELPEVSIYACVGVGTTLLVNEAGSDITPKDRKQVVPMVLGFTAETSAQHLLLNTSDPWSGDDFC